MKHILLEKIRRNVKLYNLYMFFSDAVLVGAVLIPFFSTWAGLNQAEIQTLQSINMIAILLLEIPTGLIADIYGKKISIIVGTIFSILGMIIITISPNFYLFALAEIILAFGAACKSGSDTSLIYDSLKMTKQESKAKIIMTKANSLRLLGVVLGSIAGGLIAPHTTPNIVWRLSAVPFVIALIISFFFTEPKETTNNKSEQKKWLQIFTSGLKNIFTSKTLLYQSLDMILTGTFAYFVIWFYQTKLEQMDINSSNFGIVHALVILSSASILYTTEYWLKIFTTRKFAVFSSFIAGIGFLFGGLSNSILAFALMIFLTAGFGIARSMVFTANFNKLIKSDERSTVNSTINMVSSLAISIVNPFFGYIADLNLNMTLVILGVLTILSGILSMLIQKKYEIT